ncbi:TetR/AcrR family transcriptional regulator [Devosia geojensis]|uniref:TetR/AcrR family transcriptional regulator n=1 Tax=Devosia geojensis TaxID=443610 RepID=UPI000696CCAC|nr:TetR/AcrR family transcriptional regulator [Devosia geojensis]
MANLDRTGEKRERIVEAARELFLRQGLRGTTMEAIARAAGIAKPTLYAQFSDKHAVFGAILERLVVAKIAAFEAGIAGEEPVAERVGRAIADMYRVLGGVLDGSVHADELFQAHKQAAGLFAQADARIAARLAAELEAAGIADARHLARLLLDASYGLASKTIGRETRDADIRLLAERVIGPALNRNR